MKLTIIMPLYDEEETLEQIMKKVQDVEFGIDTEVIIVNDCSKDNSQKIIDGLKNKYSNIKSFEHQVNKGKGAAIRTGLGQARGDIIVIQDADLEYNPEDIKKMLKPIIEKKTKAVYGSRFLQKNEFKMFSNYLGNKFLSFLTRLLYRQKITDMETCYKMMTSDIAKNLNLTSDRFDIEPEITSKIIKAGHKILEIPISYKGRSIEEGKKINWKDGIKAIYTLFKWRIKS